MARLLARALDAAGFQSAVEPGGVPGCSACGRAASRSLVLDLTLPDLDGVSVLTSARETHPELPVMILSALSDVRSKVMCLELGARDYMTKPFELAELIARVRMHTRDSGRGEQRRLPAGRLHARSAAARDGDAGGDVALTTREFVMLEFLVRRDGRGLHARADPRERVGLDLRPGHERRGRVHRAPAAEARRETIETVRNVGYAYVGA